MRRTLIRTYLSDYGLSGLAYLVTVFRDLVVIIVSGNVAAAEFFKFLAMCNISSSVVSNFLLLGNSFNGFFFAGLIVAASLLSAVLVFSELGWLWIYAGPVTILSILLGVVGRTVLNRKGVLVYRVVNIIPVALMAASVLIVGGFLTQSYLFSLLAAMITAICLGFLDFRSYREVEFAFFSCVSMMREAAIASWGLVFLNISLAWYYGGALSEFEVMFGRVVVVAVSVLSVPVLHLRVVNVRYLHPILWIHTLLFLFCCAGLLIVMAVPIDSNVYVFSLLACFSVIANYLARAHLLVRREVVGVVDGIAKRN